MRKLFNILIFLLFAACKMPSAAQTKGSEPYTGMAISKVTNSKSAGGNESSTSRYIYACNKAGDSIAVYHVEEGAVSTALVYSVDAVNNALYFITKPVIAGQEPGDSLKISFNDADHSVLIKNDRYTLYPEFYSAFKQQVGDKHSVIAVLNLLADQIGDYPASDAAPLLLYQAKNSSGKTVNRATIVTSRSQATDVADTWNCTYHYNNNGKLDAVKASQGKETRFSKNVLYAGSNVTAIKSYSNIEDRQENNRTVTYPAGKIAQIKLTEQVFEPGKDRKTTLSTTMTKRGIASLKAMIMAQAEVLALVK